MAEYMHLVGAEDVVRAASRMSSAADEMLRAANMISEAVDRFNRTAEDHLLRLERLVEEKPGG
jgi:hypothetical protein